MAVLNHLEPQRVFRFFEELCAIPHGSGNTKAVSDWLVDFAKARGLRYVQDQLNNVVIFRDATPGYESAEPVILQGHMDMVCEKEPGCTKDMAAEGLDLVLEGDTVSAKGTTLGGDDGIAVAMAMPYWTMIPCPTRPSRPSSPWTRKPVCMVPRAWTCPSSRAAGC